MKTSVCIATYRRPARLRALLDDLTLQHLMPDEVIVVDNDPEASALPVVEDLRSGPLPFRVVYDVQPEKNISLTRNRTVALAAGDWLAFVDDDERAPPAWLAQLMGCVAQTRADGALGPVVPVVPPEAPEWIRRGRFYDWTRLPTGALIPPNRLRFGNLVLRASLLRTMQAPFDPAYGLTGGEDGDLLSRLAQDGAVLRWCDEAVVHEPVESARLSLRWLLRRALRGGQDFARHSLAGRYGGAAANRPRLVLRALLQATAAMLLALLLLPAGRHRSVHWLTKASANFGKLSIFCGWHYREYA